MRRVLLVLALVLIPGAARADGWLAGMEDDEGGKVMVASVVGDPDGGVTPMLRLMCAGDQGVALRYEPSADAASAGSEGDFLFENESKQVTLHMAYEDMDGAFAAYFPKTDPIVDLLENGPDVYISQPTSDDAAQTFTLKGATKAIATVLKGCK